MTALFSPNFLSNVQFPMLLLTCKREFSFGDVLSIASIIWQMKLFVCFFQLNVVWRSFPKADGLRLTSSNSMQLTQVALNLTELMESKQLTCKSHKAGNSSNSVQFSKLNWLTTNKKNNNNFFIVFTSFHYFHITELSYHCFDDISTWHENIIF